MPPNRKIYSLCLVVGISVMRKTLDKLYGKKGFYPIIREPVCDHRQCSILGTKIDYQINSLTS